MKRAILSSLFALLSASAASAGWFDEETCAHTAQRNANVPAAGIQRVVIDSGAGLLRVTGQEGARDVAIRGIACSSDADYLKSMQVKMSRSGADLRIETVMPEKTIFFGFFSAKLDLTITLPAGLPVVIDDGSGSMVVQNTGNLKIEDGSGSIQVSGIRGALEIEDGSGSIDISDVAGAVTLTDGSGAIMVRNCGSVLIDEDGSGSIDIAGVKQNVKVDSDGSGSMTVANIGGDFTVRSKGSGSINYEKVAGRINIPARR